MGWAEENFEIAAILNNYKDIVDELIDSSNTKSPHWSKPIDKKSCNTPRSRTIVMVFSEGDCCNADILVRSSGLAPKTRKSWGYQYHDVAPLNSKSRRACYIKSAKGGEDRMYERGYEAIGKIR